MEKSILHCDMNNFYASVECVLNPKLVSSPIAVCGSKEERHGIVLAKNYLAKDFGVKTGDTIWQAKNKCPNIIIIDNPHFDMYSYYSKRAIDIYKKYTDKIESMGLDECWLDVTNSIKLFGKPVDIANTLRETIKSELGLTISVGVSFNKTFAKLGSDLKKPDATTVISKNNYKDIVWPLPISDLLFVGRKTKQLLNKNYIYTIGDIANSKPERLKKLLGKNGITLYNEANGLDDDEVKNVDYIDTVKSISHGITTVNDLTNNDEVWTIILELTQEISFKLRKQNLRAGGVSVNIRNNELQFEQFQMKFLSSEESAINIAKYAFSLFKNRYSWDKPIRTVTVSAIYLSDNSSPEELTILEDNNFKEKIEKVERCAQDINIKYGQELVKNATLIKNDNLPNIRRKINYDINIQK